MRHWQHRFTRAGIVVEPSLLDIKMMVTMDQPYWYEIRIEGHLAEQWSAWFDELAVQTDRHDETTLSGWIADQAALFGVLAKIHNLNLILIAVSRSAPK
jgi:hypothetical protein